MRAMRLEAGTMLAWVSPCGGLLDFSVRADDGPPRPVLRRCPPTADDTSWLAVEPRLKDDTNGDARRDPPAARLLDRTPVSARLALDTPRGTVAVRYEITPDGLRIGAAGLERSDAPCPGVILIRLDPASTGEQIEVAHGRRGEGPAGEIAVSFVAGGMATVLVRPTP